MERALAALAGSGLDSTRFAVLLDPGADLAVLDRSMTAVLAVSPGGLGAVLDRLNANTGAAWVADPHGDQRLDAGAAVEVMHGWHLGSVAELRSDRPADGDEAGWLVIEATDAELLGAIEAALKRGESPSRTAKAVAADFGVPKRRVYDLVLSLGGDR